MPIRIYTPTAWSKLRDAFDLKGKHDLQLDEIVVPVFVVNDEPVEEVEEAVAASWSFEITAAAAKETTALLLNDTASSRFIIDTILLSSQSNGKWEFRLTVTAAVDALVGAAGKSWNNNAQTPPVPGLQFADGGAFVGPVVAVGRFSINFPYVIPAGYVLDPGQALAVTSTTDNLDLEATMKGRVVDL